MKLTLDVKQMTPAERPEAALYDPKKTSTTEVRKSPRAYWTITATDQAFCVSPLSSPEASPEAGPETCK
jgi:hypothetical protein